MMNNTEYEKNPLLTIAVPTYNGSRTIRNMLDILLPQVTGEVEVMVFDNCSTDNTPEIIKEYQEVYPFIQYYRNSANLGADGNFLKAMLSAHGKFTMLVSDDDIVTEIGISRIVQFLKKNPDVSLIYLETIGFHDKYIDIDHSEKMTVRSKSVESDVRTKDRKEWFEYVGRQWGFTSSFAWNTKRCQSIENPERFFNTYWLQSYIHIGCANRENDVLGVVKGPCVAAGAYGVVNNYDTAEIEAVYYKRMLDVAVEEAMFDKKQLEKEWLWKTCFLASRAIIKERATGVNLTSTKTLFRELKHYPYAWVHLFPFFLLPDSVCKAVLKVVRWKQGRNFISYVNRPTSETRGGVIWNKLTTVIQYCVVYSWNAGIREAMV